MKPERIAPIEMAPEEFRRLGHQLIDSLADWMEGLSARPVTPAESPAELRALIDRDRPLPETGESPEVLLQRASDWMMDHSCFNSHPRFWGYITASAAPIGILGDLLASAMNPNVGGWKLSPMASEIEGQTVRWIAELIGYSPECAGLLVSGGNMANYVGFLAGRAAKAGWDVKTKGMQGDVPLRIYTSAATHTWIHNAMDLFGLGLDAVRWIPTGEDETMDVGALRSQIEADIAAGDRPIMVIGTAGSVSTGAVDDLPAIASICQEHDLWFHVDGAYGGFAAAVPGLDDRFSAIADADSVAVDPHKWLYAPLEAGCALVRRQEDLLRAFSYRPEYYILEEDGYNYFEHGMQNSRGFRALKVWLALQQVGRSGYVQMIGDDIALARHLFEQIEATEELEAGSHRLSITTFRYVPPGVTDEETLNAINERLVDAIEASGEAFVSNAISGGRFFLRACIVNFRTGKSDVEALPELAVRLGREISAGMGA
jgi:glutamate/tyrosine decarboxylase-like PLP-dependent enzyme